MPKLTQQFIDLEIQLPEAGQRFYRDDEIPGFAIRVTRKSKSYIFEKRVGGVNRRVTIGKCLEMPISEARKQAYIILGEITKGNDPRTGKRINTRKDVTLREVTQKYLEVRNLRPATQKNYRSSIYVHLHDWLDLPVNSITKDMVEQRHQELTIKPNRQGRPAYGRSNCALKRLGTIISFAMDRYGNEDEPLIKTNPVCRLSRNRSWHRLSPRQNIIPEQKLKLWYRAVLTLQNEVARDFLLFLLFTGMRFGETRKLKWQHVDFENKILTVPRELTKSDREHRLPLSDFLFGLLRKRYVYRKNSEWVFQSTRLQNQHLSENLAMVHRVSAKCGIRFTPHDLRRTFLTTAESLAVPPYALKRLVNHSISSDMTGQYLVFDIERLRAHMCRISDALLQKLEIDCIDTKDSKPLNEVEHEQIIQLRIEIDNEPIL